MSKKSPFEISLKNVLIDQELYNLVCDYSMEAGGVHPATTVNAALYEYFMNIEETEGLPEATGIKDNEGTKPREETTYSSSDATYKLFTDLKTGERHIEKK